MADSLVVADLTFEAACKDFPHSRVVLWHAGLDDRPAQSLMGYVPFNPDGRKVYVLTKRYEGGPKWCPTCGHMERTTYYA